MLGTPDPHSNSPCFLLDHLHPLSGKDIQTVASWPWKQERAANCWQFCQTADRLRSSDPGHLSLKSHTASLGNAWPSGGDRACTSHSVCGPVHSWAGAGDLMLLVPSFIWMRTSHIIYQHYQDRKKDVTSYKYKCRQHCQSSCSQFWHRLNGPGRLAYHNPAQPKSWSRASLPHTILKPAVVSPGPRFCRPRGEERAAGGPNLIAGFQVTKGTEQRQFFTLNNSRRGRGYQFYNIVTPYSYKFTIPIQD